jgi:chromosome segregation ATPase
MDVHIERSADTADELSPPLVAPTVVPRPLLYASGIGVALVTLFSWNPGWLQELERTEFFTPSRQDQVEHIEELLDQARALAPEEEKLEELSEALERLRKHDIELSEALQELSDAQEALAASQAEMDRLEMDLEELGAQMESTPALAELSEALKSQNTEEVAELLRELAERISDAQSSEELRALLESLKNANLQNEELAAMMENLEQAAGDLTAEDLAQMAEALESLAEQMENLGQQMAAQQDMDQMGQEMQQLEASLGEQQAGQQQQGEQQQSPGQAQSQAGMMSSQMQMAQMQGDPASAVPVDAGPAGDTTGPGGPGEDEVLGEATTLEVQLEMEVLSPEELDEPVPEEIFERLSREEKSTLNYEDIQTPGSYAEESAMERDSVPWQYRSLVKRYFLSILTQSSESSSEP